MPWVGEVEEATTLPLSPILNALDTFILLRHSSDATPQTKHCYRFSSAIQRATFHPIHLAEPFRELMSYGPVIARVGWPLVSHLLQLLSPPGSLPSHYLLLPTQSQSALLQMLNVTSPWPFPTRHSVCLPFLYHPELKTPTSCHLPAPCACVSDLQLAWLIWSSNFLNMVHIHKLMSFNPTAGNTCSLTSFDFCLFSWWCNCYVAGGPLLFWGTGHADLLFCFHFCFYFDNRDWT